MAQTSSGQSARGPPCRLQISLVGIDIVFVQVLSIDRSLHGRQLHTALNNALGVPADLELIWAQLCPESSQLRILVSLLHSHRNIDTWGIDSRRPLLFWGGRAGQPSREAATIDLGLRATRLHVGLLWPHWREDQCRDEFQEITCRFPLETDVTSALLRLLVQHNWLSPTARLEICLRSGRKPAEACTIRQLLLLQPELMGEWRTSFHFLELTLDHCALVQTGGPGRRLRVRLRQVSYELKVPRFERIGPALLSQPPFAFLAHAQAMREWIIYSETPHGWRRISPLSWVFQLEQPTRLHLYEGAAVVGNPYTVHSTVRGGRNCLAMVCHRAWGMDIQRPWRTKVGELKEVLERTLGVQPHRLTLTKAF